MNLDISSSFVTIYASSTNNQRKYQHHSNINPNRIAFILMGKGETNNRSFCSSFCIWIHHLFSIHRFSMLCLYNVYHVTYFFLRFWLCRIDEEKFLLSLTFYVPMQTSMALTKWIIRKWKIVKFQTENVFDSATYTEHSFGPSIVHVDFNLNHDPWAMSIS